MSASGPGELAVIEERLTTRQYVEILEDVLLPTVRAMLIPAPQPIYVAMDNAPVHNSKQVEEWFRQHPEVIRIQWPPRSPDLMPIEHLWAAMTREWDGSEVKNKENLIAHAREIWEKLRATNECQRLVASMPHRILKVIESGGFYTKY